MRGKPAVRQRIPNCSCGRSFLQLKAYVRYSKFTPFNSFTKDRNDEIAVFVERTREKHGNPGLRQSFAGNSVYGHELFKNNSHGHGRIAVLIRSVESERDEMKFQFSLKSLRWTRKKTVILAVGICLAGAGSFYFFPSGNNPKEHHSGFLYPNDRSEKNNAEQFDQSDRHGGKRVGIERHDEPVAGGEVDSRPGRGLGRSRGYHLCPGHG